MFLLILGAYLIISVGGFNSIHDSGGKVAGLTTFEEESSLSTPAPTKIPTPTPSPTPTPTPKSRSDLDLASNQGPTLVSQINDFRASKGLGPVQSDPHTCSFASLRANEITSNFNHDGFRNRIDSKNLPYPSYSSVAENIAMNGDENQIIPGWINSPGHLENLLKDVPFGCVVGNGSYYVFEAWKP